jgi:hypothetical protein
MSTEAYNGWTNRETWAVALHINNDQGWQESVHEALTGARESERMDHHRDLPAWKAGDVIRESVENTLVELLDAVESAEPNYHSASPTGARMTYEGVRDDIGSLWRVDWTELGAAFLQDITE